MKLTFPLKGIGKTPGIYLTQHFGETLSDYSQFGLKGHNGVDWAAPLDTPVYAVTDGWVIEAVAKDTGYGLRVSQYFEADGFQWLLVYGHFHKINYPDIQWTSWDFDRKANPVRSGQLLGFVDSTGFSTGNHLHLGLYKYQNGQLVYPNNGYGGAIDVLPFLKGEPCMSNTLLVKKGSEFGFYVPATNEQALIDKGLNFGVPIPTTDNGTKVDFANLKPDLTI